MEEHASDLAELPVPVIWQNCLSVDSVPMIGRLSCARIACMRRSVPVIWQKSLLLEERANALAELPVPVIWQNSLSVESVPVIWQNSQYVEERASDLA